MRVDVAPRSVTITLDRPGQRNAQTPRTWEVLARVGELVGQSDVPVVVLRAEGPSFSAGLDRSLLVAPRAGSGAGDGTLGALAALSDPELDERLAGYQGAFTWWREVDAVTVAAVGGHAIGAGFQLALACDLRVVADDVAFAMRETSLGLVPDLGGTSVLVSLVGYPRALELCATGRVVGAAEAVRLGLAETAVPRGELDAAVDDLCAALLTAPPAALAATKRLLRGAGERTHGEQLAAERRSQAELLRDRAGAAASAQG